MNELLETIKILGAASGSMITICSLLMLFLKPTREWVVKNIKKHMEDDKFKSMMLDMNESLTKHICDGELQNEALLSMLRCNITQSYYKYINSDGIPSYERENLIKQFDIYTNMGGNSYVTLLYNELLDVPVLNK